MYRILITLYAYAVRDGSKPKIIKVNREMLKSISGSLKYLIPISLK